MKIVEIIACLVVLIIISVSPLTEIIEADWDIFKFQFKKTYSNVEEDGFRKFIYQNNKVKIDQHNELYKLGLVTYALELNHFSDLTLQEYTATVNGFKHSLVAKGKNESDAMIFMKSENENVSMSIDWRTKGYVTPIKNQGLCGSCWSFSATGALEGQYYRKTGVLVPLSEQNLIDCSGIYGNDGCDGGIMNLAFKYIKENKGLNTEQSYPYEAKNNECHYNPENNGAVSGTGFVNIPEGDEDALANAVATVGPVSVAIDASSYKFQFYKKGIYYNPNECSSGVLNHAALVVGYGTNSEKEDYWIVKNSWGTSWGEYGYVLMARNKNNHCGIATSASYPIV